MKIGQSIDIHRLVVGRQLILGGVEITNPVGLLGHSDADVLSHAIAEAIIGALGKGDLGSWFSDNDEKNKNRNSLTILAEVKEMMIQAGYRIGNVDTLILLEEPKLQPYIFAMRQKIAEILLCDISLINIKATRGEGLGFIGRQEGAVASAVVLLKGKEDE